MMTDAKLAFVPIGTPLSLIAAAGVDIPSPLVVDLLGNGVGTLVTNIYGNSAVPGQADGMGVGAERPELNITIGTTVTTSSSATLNVQIQGAPDNGSGSPGTWSTFGESGAIAVALLTANTVVCRLPWLPPWPFNQRPRFIRLNFEIPAATSFTAGTIASALVTTVRDDYYVSQAAKNYVIGPLN